MLANYRWFFRLMAIICIVFSIITIMILPYTGSTYSSKGETTPRWKRMDIIGVTILIGALICFILSLTQGPIDGWSSASFIAPFCLAIPLVVAFFFWGQYSAGSTRNRADKTAESRIPPKSAVLPSSVWKITNILISSLAIMFPFSFWATSQLQYSTFWQEVFGWKPSAYRFSPTLGRLAELPSSPCRRSSASSGSDRSHHWRRCSSRTSDHHQASVVHRHWSAPYVPAAIAKL